MFILMGGIELGKGGLLFVRRGWGRWMFFRFGKFLSYAFVGFCSRGGVSLGWFLGVVLFVGFFVRVRLVVVLWEAMRGESV